MSVMSLVIKLVFSWRKRARNKLNKLQPIWYAEPRLIRAKKNYHLSYSAKQMITYPLVIPRYKLCMALLNQV